MVMDDLVKGTGFYYLSLPYRTDVRTSRQLIRYTLETICKHTARLFSLSDIAIKYDFMRRGVLLFAVEKILIVALNQYFFHLAGAADSLDIMPTVIVGSICWLVYFLLIFRRAPALVLVVSAGLTFGSPAALLIVIVALVTIFNKQLKEIDYGNKGDTE